MKKIDVAAIAAARRGWKGSIPAKLETDLHALVV
jgi:hypothetical protein